jgi:hypothetical protein
MDAQQNPVSHTTVCCQVLAVAVSLYTIHGSCFDLHTLGSCDGQAAVGVKAEAISGASASR